MRRTFKFIWCSIWFLFVVFVGAIILDDMSRLFAERECEAPTITELRPEFGTRPPGCAHLYNVGQSEAWAECMGVGFVLPGARRELRDDMLRGDL